MSNIIDSIRLSGTTYQIQGSGGGGTQAIELTQAQYDALVDKDPNVFYIITDAEAGDLTNYYTKTETNTLLDGKADTATTYTKQEVDNAITAATSTKQDTLVSGTNIKTINNESILGSGNIDIQGGGKAVSGGTNISITTGETADTINCTLPISVGRNTIEINKKNIKIGTNNTTSNNDRVHCVIGENSAASGIYSFAFGVYSKATNYSTVSMGYGTESNNQYQASFGRYNTSSNGSSTFGDSGNTLFSVGNGTANLARHNAFEIRQNGDIYLTLDGQDVKLQDQLGGSSITVDTALDSGSTNPVENKAIYNKFDEVEQVTAAALNELNDAISGKVDTSTYNTYTAATDTALNGKQPTLVSGTNIKTINNQSILGSGNIDIQGGSTYTAGRGIDIANDTISVSLPISAGTGMNSIIEGGSTTASGNYSHAEGYNTTASGGFSHAEGVSVTAKNVAEHASGRYNVSSSASTTFGDSGNTLFSVGNGTSNNARHNAFEIRQNGDIYLTKDGQDIKLQDQLGGSSITVDTALDSGSTNPVENRAIYNKFDEVEQVTAAGLNAVNDKFDGLRLKKLTEAEYNNLQTKDPSTLYVIVD